MTNKKDNKSYYYSKISTAYDCLKKFELQYILGVPLEGPRSADMEFGTAIHAGCQAYLEGANGNEIFKLTWQTDKLSTDLIYSRFDWEALDALGQRFMTNFERLHLPKIKPKSVETRLYALVEGLQLEGTPDVIGLYDGKPSVIDFKTSAYPYDKAKIEISEQMYLYSHLAKLAFDYDVTQLVFKIFVKSTGSIQTLTKELTKEKLTSMVSNVMIVAKELENRKVFYANRNSCIKGQFVCPYYNHCYNQGVKDGTK